MTTDSTIANAKMVAPAAPPRRQLMDQLLPAGSLGAVTHWLPTQWPRIGGRKLAMLPADAFELPAYKQHYVAGGRIAIYAAGCGFDHANSAATGLVGLARRLMAAVHKLSTTTQTDLRMRLEELNKDHYAALTTSADGYPCSDLGFDTWMMQHILPRRLPLAGSPVAIGDRCLIVRLPAGMTPREFDKQLAYRMRNARLNSWLETPDGRRHCEYLGIAPAQLARGTVYGFNEALRRSDGEEIYFFRPKSFDADRLLRLAETIVYRYVTTPPTLRRTISWRSRAQGTRSDFRPPAP
ncbi:hypothetical protein [Bosea sp. (in: a-proteobacteria)]|jgi:hypothetical protein|uniref:hypothetical protein n=1 Tax=Bosea sp. (in: a-proteobacteria) TaxID=1871050 RepID=UPI002DDD1A5F|nr:hypothetical protein [Bosea sp. (in: a-proteobacteria)]HEV2510372.1 hypothetical protein [Bosea sp. (in: a-proteobacteria)]